MKTVDVIEKDQEVKTFRVRLYCGECGEEMLPNGQAYMMNPPMYPHFCKNGHEYRVIGEYFPKIEYRET